jgi:heme oxygenase
VNSSSATLARLDHETGEQHRSAAEGWRRLCRYKPTKRDYVEQLAATYGFEAPLEAAIAYTPELGRLLDGRLRPRAGYIAQDLLDLDFTPSDVSRILQCLPIAPFPNAVSALGWMYVVERVALTHGTVREHLQTHLPIAAQACAYLSASGESRWAALGSVIDSVVRPEQLSDLLIAAHAAFRTHAHWFKRVASWEAYGS